MQQQQGEDHLLEAQQVQQVQLAVVNVDALQQEEDALV